MSKRRLHKFVLRTRTKDMDHSENPPQPKKKQSTVNNETKVISDYSVSIPSTSSSNPEEFSHVTSPKPIVRSVSILHPEQIFPKVPEQNTPRNVEQVFPKSDELVTVNKNQQVFSRNQEQVTVNKNQQVLVNRNQVLLNQNISSSNEFLGTSLTDLAGFINSNPSISALHNLHQATQVDPSSQSIPTKGALKQFDLIQADFEETNEFIKEQEEKQAAESAPSPQPSITSDEPYFPYPPTPVFCNKNRIVHLMNENSGFHPGYGYFEMIPPTFKQPEPQYRWHNCTPPDQSKAFVEYPLHRPEVIEAVYKKAALCSNVHLATNLARYLRATSDATLIARWLSSLPGWQDFLQNVCFFGEQYELNSTKYLCKNCFNKSSYYAKKKEKGPLTVLRKIIHVYVNRDGLRDLLCGHCCRPIHTVREIIRCPDCLFHYGVQASLKAGTPTPKTSQ